MASSSDLHERCRETSRGVNVELHFTFGDAMCDIMAGMI